MLLGAEGKTVVDFAIRMEMTVVNAFKGDE